MCGTFGYELDPRKLTDDEKAEVKQQIADYRKYHRLAPRGAISTASSPPDRERLLLRVGVRFAG